MCCKHKTSPQNVSPEYNYLLIFCFSFNLILFIYIVTYIMTQIKICSME